MEAAVSKKTKDPYKHQRYAYEAFRRRIDPDGVYGVEEVAKVAGVTRRTLARWKHAGVPIYHADKLAVSIGLHPVDVWPDWFDDVSEDDDEEVAA